VLWALEKFGAGGILTGFDDHARGKTGQMVTQSVMEEKAKGGLCR
jgi:hypothetical protein